ncbi:hypothetical protein T484DRAFT_1768510 [Baffinella frigidus]|nr:hypothetical protein T484DRAFT_1768510 [Cryptophyta sp. CCMP2293]
MFAKKERRGNIRKRPVEEVEEGDQEEGKSAVVQKTKTAATGPLVASTTADKKDKKEAFYESNRTAMPSIGHDNNAVADLEEADAPTEEADNNGVYKGAGNYQKFHLKREVMDKKATSIGPIKAPTNVRMTCRFDYQPDVCKDYKETGYCGFGDSCKFQHDRGDYKSGWELDRDWDASQLKKKMDAAAAELAGEQEEQEVDDGLPFACSICRGPFNSPVETKCQHYFCEGCALANYTKSKRCFICNEQTHGVFNNAKKLIAKIKRMKGKEEGKGKEEDEDEMGGGSGGAWAEIGKKSFEATNGWQIPGNTFRGGKEF